MNGFQELQERLSRVTKRIVEGVDKEDMLDIFDEIYNEDAFIEADEERGQDIYQGLEYFIQRARQSLVRLVNSDIPSEDIPTCWWEGRDAWDPLDSDGVEDYLGGLVKAEKGEKPEMVSDPSESKEAMIKSIKKVVNQIYSKEGLKLKHPDRVLGFLSDGRLRALARACEEGDEYKIRGSLIDLELEKI